MPKLTFNTVSPDLLEYVELAASQARAQGYRVVAEPSGAYFPVSPTVLGTAAQRELVIEAVSKVSFESAKKWMAYGRAQQKETKVLIIAPPQKKNVAIDEIQKFQGAGIGLSVGNDGAFVVLANARDLSTQIVCPDISKDKATLQKRLRPCFAKIDNGEIVDGFKDVAALVESAARKHLAEGVKSGRIKFASSAGNPITYALKDINKGTMGWLRDRFAEIVAPNGIDNVVLQAFKAVVPDRNIASHQVLNARSKRSLHARIAKHLLVLHQAARQLL